MRVTKETNIRMLLCPFCGGKPLRRDIGGLWTIECRECGAQSAVREHYQSAIAAWNCRHVPERTRRKAAKAPGKVV